MKERFEILLEVCIFKFAVAYFLHDVFGVFDSELYHTLLRLFHSFNELILFDKGS